MAFGGVLGIVGVPLPGVELSIAISGTVLGAMVFLGARPPLYVAAILVGYFAIFHGFAHGDELVNAKQALSYCLGFVLSTGLLHLNGICLGFLVKWPWGVTVTKVGGLMISATGFLYLVGVM